MCANLEVAGFDVEIAFIVPVATVFREWVLAGKAGLALFEIGMFLAILFVGLIVVWNKGDLEWLKQVPGARKVSPERANTAPIREAA